MSGEALLFMLASWGIIYGLTVYCFTMLMTNPPSEGEKENSPRKDRGYWKEEEIT
jgi:hypothetical protein